MAVGDNADVDVANLLSSFLTHPLHQQLLQSDTETIPFNPLKTQNHEESRGDSMLSRTCWIVVLSLWDDYQQEA